MSQGAAPTDGQQQKPGEKHEMEPPEGTSTCQHLAFGLPDSQTVLRLISAICELWQFVTATLENSNTDKLASVFQFSAEL